MDKKILMGMEFRRMEGADFYGWDVPVGTYIRETEEMDLAGYLPGQPKETTIRATGIFFWIAANDEPAYSTPVDYVVEQWYTPDGEFVGTRNWTVPTWESW